MENEDVNKTDLGGVCAGHICAIHKLKFQKHMVEGESWNSIIVSPNLITPLPIDRPIIVDCKLML